MTVQSRKTAVAWLSVVSNSTLVVLKLVVGLMIGSVAVISEAVHSGMDLVASIVALLAVKTSAKPADEKHAFGHGKFENVAGAFEASLIFVAAAWIVYEAVRKLLDPLSIELNASAGAIVMMVSAVVNWFVSRLLFKVGRETESVALQADGWHLRTDVWTSLGVMVGLGMIWLGDLLWPDLGNALHVIDPIAAILVAALIVKAAWDLTVRSVHDLVDVNLPKDEEDWIRQTLASFVPRLHGFHRMRTRRAGPIRFIEFHLFVDGQMTVDESHRLGHEVSRRIQAHFPQSSVTVHMEPCRGECYGTCRAGCLLSDEARQALQHAKEGEA